MPLTLRAPANDGDRERPGRDRSFHWATLVGGPGDNRTWVGVKFEESLHPCGVLPAPLWGPPGCGPPSAL